MRDGFADTNNAHDFVSLSERHLVLGCIRWAAQSKAFTQAETMKHLKEVETKTKKSFSSSSSIAPPSASAASPATQPPILCLEWDTWDANARLEFCRKLGFLNEAGPGCSEAHVDLGAEAPPDPQVNRKLCA